MAWDVLSFGGPLRLRDPRPDGAHELPEEDEGRELQGEQAEGREAERGPAVRRHETVFLMYGANGLDSVETSAGMAYAIEARRPLRAVEAHTTRGKRPTRPRTLLSAERRLQQPGGYDLTGVASVSPDVYRYILDLEEVWKFHRKNLEATEGK